MQNDPIVEEIRNIREAHTAKFNFNLKDICADLKKKEKESGHPVVSLPAKRHFKETGS